MSEKLNVYQRLQRVQHDLKVPKAQNNSFGGYKYRSAEDILEAVKPLLDQHGLALTISDDLKLIGDRYYVEASASVFNVENPELALETDFVTVHAYAREEETKKGMDGSQITGAASSYSRKYALNGLFAIDDTKDADSHDNRGMGSPKPAQRPQVAEDKRPTTKQLAAIKDLFKELNVAHEDRVDFFQLAIGKDRPESKDEFAKVIEYAENIKADQAAAARELGARV